MVCQKCGANVPEDKIYCEKCGMAIQMVPDYRPEEDISIGGEENQREDSSGADRIPPAKGFWKRHWKCGVAGVLLFLFGSLSFQAAYDYVRSGEETMTKPLEPETRMLPGCPKFGIEPGTYSYSPMVTLSYHSEYDGDIYYTTDGTTPDEESRCYQSSFSVGEGMTVVRAVFIRSDGMQSEEASGTYHVEFHYPDEPIFSIPSGTYVGGLSVTITSGEDCRIYYTTNGEEPGPQSRLYRGPVTIPPGLTVLQAVAIDEDGGSSGIVEAIYNVSENSGTLGEENDGFAAEVPVNQ